MKQNQDFIRKMKPELRTALLCSHCLRPLKNDSSNRCRYCQQPYDLSDPSTYTTDYYHTEWYLRPPSLFWTITYIFANIIFWVEISNPTDTNLIFLLPFPILLFGTLMLFIRIAIAFFREKELSTEVVEKTWCRLFLSFLFFFLTATMFLVPGLSNLPFGIRFKLSNSSFEKAIVECRNGTFYGNQRVGLFYVKTFESIQGNNMFWFQTGTTGDRPRPCGFEYSTTPPEYYHSSIPFTSNWYITFRSSTLLYTEPASQEVSSNGINSDGVSETGTGSRQ